jgi:hypothetical protein
LSSSSGILDGVTIGGSNFTFADGSFTLIRNNLTLASGVTVNMGNSSWGFNTTGPQSLATATGAATINIAGGVIYAGYSISGQSLTLGSGITLRGYGTLQQSSAADITNNGTIVGNTAGQTFTLNAATFTNNGTLSVTAGTMSVTPTTFNQPGTVNLGAGATFTRTGGFINAGAIAGSGTLNLGTTGTLTNNGSLTPGGTGASGSLIITGNLINGASGTINAEIGGTVAVAQYDLIVVSGSATVGGTLNASLINGFVPGGQSFDIITGASVSGSFATSNLPSGFNGAVVGNVYRLTQSGSFCFGICWSGGAGTQNWGDAANWTGGVLPGLNDIVQLNLVSGVTVSHATGNDIIKGLNSTANNNLVISGGSITLNDPATTSTLAGSLTLSGTGTLTSNGTLNATALSMSGGTLDGAGSLVVSNSFSQSAGIINLGGSATITQASGALSLGQITAGAISATAQAGSLSVTGPLAAQSGAITLTGTSGTMTLSGAIQASGAVTITNASSIDFSGTLSFRGTGVINVGGAGTFTNNGVLRPGGAGTVGTLAVNGNFAQGAGGTLDMEVAGASVYDRLAVSGTASLGGTLTVTPVGYTPVNGDQYALLTYSGSPTGTFATITAPAFAGATPSYAAGSFTLSMPAAAINTWLFDGSDSWLNPARWSEGHAPVAGEVVIIPDYTTQFTVSIPSGTQVVGSITVQGNDILAVNGGSLTLSLPSTINGTLAVAGGTVTANASLGVNTFNFSSGAYNGSGNLTVTNAFSHTGGAFNTAGAVSITQAAGNLALSQSLSAGSLLVSVAAGNLAVSGGVTLQTTGATTLNAANISIQDTTVNATALTLAGAGNVTFPAGNVVLNTPVTTSMPVIVGGATVSFNGTTSMPDLTLTAGTLGGTGDLAITSSFTQTGGSVGTSFNSLSITQGSGDLTVGPLAAATTLVLDALNGSVNATGTLSAGASVFISGNGVNVAAVTGGAVVIDANAGVLNVNGAIASSGNNPIALAAADVNIPVGGSVNAGTGVVTIASTAGGAVILGSGANVANTLTLSNAELGRIGAGVLGIDGGAISNDTAVTISGIGTVSLVGASAQFGSNFSVSGDLLTLLSGGLTLSAGTAPVLVQANNVTIAANSVSLSAGTAAGAYAAIEANGNANVAASGAVTLTGGNLVDSDAWIVAAGNIVLTASTCTGCTTRLPSISPLPWTNSVVDSGLAANGSITVVLAGGQPNQVVQQVVADTNKNLPPPPPPPPPPPAETVASQTGSAPALTDPNGTVGGEAGTFGGSQSGAGESSSSGGQTQGGKRAPAKKANARC